MRTLLLVASLAFALPAFGQGLAKWEPARTNYAPFSGGMSTATAATSPWALTNATVATVDGVPSFYGGGTWAEVTNTVNTGSIAIGSLSVTRAVTTVSASVVVAKASGTGYFDLMVGTAAFAPTYCACTRSDGGTCTATITGGSNYCKAQIADLGTNPVRLCITTTGAAKTVFLFQARPGQDGVAVGTTRIAAAQMEIGAGCTSPIKTGASPRFRRAGVVGAKNI